MERTSDLKVTLPNYSDEKMIDKLFEDEEKD
jgi:hypothetical protein